MNRVGHQIVRRIILRKNSIKNSFVGSVIRSIKNSFVGSVIRSIKYMVLGSYTL